jgi:hypothetical protein
LKKKKKIQINIQKDKYWSVNFRVNPPARENGVYNINTKIIPLPPRA